MARRICFGSEIRVGGLRARWRWRRHTECIETGRLPAASRGVLCAGLVHQRRQWAGSWSKRTGERLRVKKLVGYYLCAQGRLLAARQELGTFCHRLTGARGCYWLFSSACALFCGERLVRFASAAAYRQYVLVRFCSRCRRFGQCWCVVEQSVGAA